MAEHKSSNSSSKTSDNSAKSSNPSSTTNEAISSPAISPDNVKYKAHNNNNNVEKSRNSHLSNELSSKLSSKHALKIKKQLNALLEKTSKNSVTPLKESSHGQSAMSKHHQSTGAQLMRSHHHAIALTVEPAAPLEQTEKLEIKLEESPQHRELQLSLLRAAQNQSPNTVSALTAYQKISANSNSEMGMDFESKLAASKISNALALTNKQNNILETQQQTTVQNEDNEENIKEDKANIQSITINGYKAENDTQQNDAIHEDDNSLIEKDLNKSHHSSPQPTANNDDTTDMMENNLEIVEDAEMNDVSNSNSN